MAKKKGKKKAILKRLVAKRGERSRKRKEVKKGKKQNSHLIREKTEKAFRESASLAEEEEFKSLHFDQEILTRYLMDVERREVSESRLFLQRGVEDVMTISFLEEVKERLKTYHEQKMVQNRERATVARFVLGWLEHDYPPSEIPFFLVLFLRDVKNNPLSDTGPIWKILQPFHPTRIISPESREKGLISIPTPVTTKEEEKEERDKRYPHIILPK